VTKEANEKFFLLLSNARGARFADGSGTGNHHHDD